MRGRSSNTCRSNGGSTGMRNIAGYKAPSYGTESSVLKAAEGKTVGMIPDGESAKPRLDRPGRKHGGKVMHHHAKKRADGGEVQDRNPSDYSKAVSSDVANRTGQSGGSAGGDAIHKFQLNQAANAMGRKHGGHVKGHHHAKKRADGGGVTDPKDVEPTRSEDEYLKDHPYSLGAWGRDALRILKGKPMSIDSQTQSEPARIDKQRLDNIISRRSMQEKKDGGHVKEPHHKEHEHREHHKHGGHVGHHEKHEEHKAHGGESGKWMQHAVKHPGALHRELHVPMGKKIPEKKLEKAEHSENPKLKRKAVLAETFREHGHKKD